MSQKKEKTASFSPPWDLALAIIRIVDWSSWRTEAMAAIITLTISWKVKK